MNTLGKRSAIIIAVLPLVASGWFIYRISHATWNKQNG